MDPNVAHSHHHSEDSMSGDDFARTRKRMRSNNKKLHSSGRDVDLPKARQHHAFADSLYEADAAIGYLTDSAVDHYNFRLALAWRDDALLSARTSNIDFVLTPVRSLEITEVAQEYAGSTLAVTDEREVEEKTNKDPEETSIKSIKRVEVGKIASVPIIEENLQIPVPAITGKGNDSSEKKHSESATESSNVGADYLGTWQPPRPSNFLN